MGLLGSRPSTALGTCFRGNDGLGLLICERALVSGHYELGLEVVKLWPSSCYIKHRSTPWYVLCIQALKQNRQHLSRYQRFTLAMGSPGAVHDVYRVFEMNRERWKVAALEKLQETAQDLFSSSVI